MRVFLTCLLLLTLLPVPVFASSPLDSGWEQIDNDEGVLVYRREIPGSPLIAFRGIGTVDATLAKLASIIFDNSRATEWVDSLEDARIVRRISQSEYIQYDHIGTPIVMKDRDFLSRVRIEEDREKRQIIFRFTPAEDPSVRETKYVRGLLLNSTFTLTDVDGAKSRFDGEIHCDPKGSVPKWIVNLFQKKWPLNTIRGIRAQAAKPDVVENPRFKW